MRVGTIVGGVAGIVLVASVAFGITRGQASASAGEPASAKAQRSTAVPVPPVEPPVAVSESEEPTPTPNEATQKSDQAEPKSSKPEPAPRASSPEPESAPVKPAAPKSQRFKIAIGSVGYEPSVVNATAGSPIVLTVAQGEGCAAGFLMPDLGVNADNSAGDAKVDLGRVDRGTYRFTCGMGMVEGKLVVR
ncbi:MAG: cupredoxin domain-containing protein [Coriobacteriales bacterium]|nr:cupredoxin domain-containing protein [Coriobacteriales bacterium]